MKALASDKAKDLCCEIHGLLTAGRYMELDRLMEESRESKEYRKYVNRYPALGLSITRDQAETIRQLFDTADRPPKTATVKKCVTDPIAKVLYALVWKNAEANRIPHILAGIEDVYRNKVNYPDRGLVMYQFGRHLADSAEPIVDQHSIRAFRLLDSIASNGSPNMALRRESTVTAQDIKAYKTWLGTLPDHATNMRTIDMALFFLGKACKSSREE